MKLHPKTSFAGFEKDAFWKIQVLMLKRWIIHQAIFCKICRLICF
jgi:hypothetical protein